MANLVTRTLNKLTPAAAGPLINTGRRPLCRSDGDLGKAVRGYAARCGALSDPGRCATDHQSCARLRPSIVRARWRP